MRKRRVCDEDEGVNEKRGEEEKREGNMV